MLAPLLILLVAAGLARVCAGPRGLTVAFVALMLVGAGWSLQADIPLESQRRAQVGIDALAQHLKQTPVATVIYDPWLGWELAYYLGPWHDKRRVHYPTAAALAAGALALPESGDRYFVSPLEQPHANWLAALAAAGFGIEEDIGAIASSSTACDRPKAKPPIIGG